MAPSTSTPFPRHPDRPIGSFSRPRLKAPAFLPVAYYHCVSRVVNREFVFGDEERDKLVEYMRLYERFGELRVISYCIMSNHFHILV